MNWSPDPRILELMGTESGMFLAALRFCPEPIARQAASLLYYESEVNYHILRPAYTPPRLIGGNSIANFLAFQESMSGIMDASTDVHSNLMEYEFERDPAVLVSLRERCAEALSRFGLGEVPGILSAIAGLPNMWLQPVKPSEPYIEFARQLIARGPEALQVALRNVSAVTRMSYDFSGKTGSELVNAVAAAVLDHASIRARTASRQPKP